MINAQNYKNGVIKLWEVYKEFVLKAKKQMKDVNADLNYTEEGKRNKKNELIQQIQVANERQGKELLNYIQEGIEYLNRKLTPSTDPKKLLDTINLLKEIGSTLNAEEILKITEEFHQNPIAIKSINNVIEDRVKHIPFPPLYQIIKMLEVTRLYIEQAIAAAGSNELYQDTFEGWEFKTKIVEINIKDIPDKL
ncbi:hypothetical protein [Clostridium tunisiense]|uniref:hypothetical protein n=1 Tax=Clostridium tunisiense TaxID=219748 RepID=UPI0002DD7342|nr:hypothetical protein [Clostridium tunisiense]